MPYGPKPLPLPDRFWPKVDKRRPDQCWLWTGHTNGAGYGQIFRGNRKELAHRIAWELENGSIPKRRIILHRCDNSACVNPAHLLLGTQRDNMQDRSDKRMDNYTPHFSKLAAEDVVKIVDRYKSGDLQSVIAADFNVSGPTVSQIIRGKIWTHVTRNLDLPERGRRHSKERKLSDDDIRRIRALYAEGETQKALGDAFGVSKALVQQIVTGRAWKHVS